MKNNIVLRSLGTHDGSFHADEVTACAFLLLYNFIDFDKIIRTRDQEKLATCEIVCDVGGIYDPKIKRFDHHQATYQGSFSSAGMILKYLKDEKIMDEATYHYFNVCLVRGVDAVDNGKSPSPVGYCSFSAVIANFVPVRHDAEDKIMDGAFFQAVEFVLGHLRRLRAKFEFIQENKSTVEEEMKKNQKVLIFETSMPWIESFFEYGGKNHPALFVVMPSKGKWKLRGIPPTFEKRMQVRLPLPREWAGLRDDALKEKTNIDGAIFCHKGRFISIWETKEDALKALDLVLGAKKRK